MTKDTTTKILFLLVLFSIPLVSSLAAVSIHTEIYDIDTSNKIISEIDKILL